MAGPGMDPALHHALRVALGAVFLWAGTHKLRDLTGFTDVRPIEDLFDYLGESIERGDPVWISTRPGSRSRAATTARSRRIASARRTSSTVAPAARTPCAPTSRSTSAPR